MDWKLLHFLFWEVIWNHDELMNFACVANNKLSENLNNIDNLNCPKASETILSSLINNNNNNNNNNNL